MKCRYPFPENVEFERTKPTGDFAHEKYLQSKHAVDFILPLGTPVLAVKKGVVVLAKYDSDVHYSTTEVNGLTESEKKDLANRYTNHVVINHKDKIFTEYAHLEKGEVVSKRQNVEEGEIIGYVGLSGITDLPHLHFNAFKIESIPVKFIE